MSPARAAGLGALWGVTMAYGVAWWLPGMISAYLERSWVVGWTGFAAVALCLFASYLAVFAAWLSAVARRGLAGPLVVAAGWGACEFARSRLLVGNPWALAGYSQTSHTALLQIADATGPYGVGMLIAGVNAALAGVLAPELRGRRPIIAGITLGALLALVWGYGEWRLAQPFATGAALKVAVVQGAIERRASWRPDYAGLGVGRYLALTRSASASHPDLIFWPENAVNFYLQKGSPERSAVMDGTRDLAPALIVGGPAYAIDAAGTRYYNSIFLLRAGEIADRYDKQRLLPLAERPLLGLDDVDPRFTAGTRERILDALGTRVGAFVCFEAMYPELVRKFAQAGAQVLANLSNDAWFGSAAASRHHLDMAALRAIENRRYLVRATSTGFSAIIDPHGRVRAQSRLDMPDVLTQPIRASDATTPYQRWGDAPAWAAALLVLLTFVRSRAPDRA